MALTCGLFAVVFVASIFIPVPSDASQGQAVIIGESKDGSSHPEVNPSDAHPDDSTSGSDADTESPSGSGTENNPDTSTNGPQSGGGSTSTPTPSPNPSPTPSTPRPSPTTPSTPSVSKPTVAISVSPTTITRGNSATLGWNATNSPSTCTASGAWSGTQPASGTRTIAPTASATYSLTCSNSGGSASASTTVTVNVPPPTCGNGGACSATDIARHATATDCWSAMNATGAGLATYSVSSSFLTLHQPKKSITLKICGKVYNVNLRSVDIEHQNGTKLGGLVYQTWMNNFYIGPYK